MFVELINSNGTFHSNEGEINLEGKKLRKNMEYF